MGFEKVGIKSCKVTLFRHIFYDKIRDKGFLRDFLVGGKEWEKRQFPKIL